MTRSTPLKLLPLLALPLAAAAYFGGWATITVQDLPDGLVADQPTNLAFTVRQHGHDLLTDLRPSIEAVNGKSRVVVNASRSEARGQYAAQLTVPESGVWAIKIKSGFGDSDVALLPMAAVAKGAAAPALPMAERGRRFFVAKGCTSCHEHAAVPGSGRFDVGPVLTDRHYPKEFLTPFLKDPSTRITPGMQARMPNLNLSAAEIEALTAFINGTGKAAVSMR